MTTLDRINELLAANGKTLLSTIVVHMSDVQSRYNRCELFRKIVNTKFDLEKLKTTGYTLQEVLTTGTNVLGDEIDRFVLFSLKKYINAQAAK